MSKYYKVDEVESLLSCGCAYAIRDLPTIEVMEYPQVDGITPTVITPEVSEDAISREWILEEYQKGKEKISKSEDFAELMWLVKHAPSVMPKPKEGEWVYGEHDVAMCDGYRCDRCGFFVPWDYEHKSIDFINDYNYCPDCGAKMKGTEDE